MQALNIHALLTDEKFKNRFNALKTIATQLEKSNVTWAVYSSAAMFLLGITPDFGDWDIFTLPSDAEKTFAIFEAQNEKNHPLPPETKAQYFNPPCKTYTVKNTDFDVSPEFEIKTFGTKYMYHLKKEDLLYINVDDLKIPVCPAEALFIIYYMMTGWQPNRKIKVKWLKEYLLAGNLNKPSILFDARNQNLPIWIKEDINSILHI